MEWKLGKLIKNRNYKLWGVNIFDCPWTDTGETVLLKDYTDGIRKDFKIYSVDVEGEAHCFAAMERGADTWLFFVGT